MLEIIRTGTSEKSAVHRDGVANAGVGVVNAIFVFSSFVFLSFLFICLYCFSTCRSSSVPSVSLGRVFTDFNGRGILGVRKIVYFQEETFEGTVAYESYEFLFLDS